MSNERFFMEVSAPNGRIVRLGDKFVNQQGIELAVSRIYRPFDSEDILVEFIPLDAALSGGSWCNELLMDCEEPVLFANRVCSRCPCLSLDRLDEVKALEDLILDKKIVGVEYVGAAHSQAVKRSA
jgi:hypothetical protein